MTHNCSIRRICHLEERREWGWGAGDCRAGGFEYHSFGHPGPPVMRTFVGGMLCGPPAWVWTCELSSLYLTNTRRRNECAPGSQSLRLVQPVARVLEPRFLLSWLATGDGPCARVHANPRFFTRWLQSLESEAGAKFEGPLLARREFRAWEGTVRSQESWLIRQIPAWTRVRMLWAPAPRQRPEAVVAVPGRCSGASRFLLRTPGARLGLAGQRCGPFPQHPHGGGAVSVPRTSLALGLVGRQTLPRVSLSPPTPSRNNQKLESATGACSPVGSRASRTLSRSCARRLVCASWECPWHRDSHPRAYSPFPRNGVLLCRG